MVKQYYVKYKDEKEYRDKANSRSKKHYEDNRNKKLAYQKKYRLNNPDKIKAYRDNEINKKRSKELSKANYDKRKENGERLGCWIKNRFESIPCIDCERVFPFCAMDFDHRPEEIKSFCIGHKGSNRITPKNIAMVMEEIDKCDLVCATCHRIRTYNRRNNDR